MEGLIFDIKHYAIHDGPGIRQTIFYKGCPLSCWWCHNPESQKKEIETFDKERTLDGQTFKRREKVGYTISPDELFKIIEKDTVFFDESGGGVTFSGGEPLMQPEFLQETARLCHEANIHTALDTCGYASREDLLKVIPFINLILYDLKITDNEKHKKYTGVSNQVILENLIWLAESNKDVRIRFPVIPGITNTAENLEEIKEFLSSLKTIKNIDILPYHDISRGKYQRFKKEQKMGNVHLQSDESEKIKKEFSSLGYHVQIGG
jgi:pyruvate formate lyase activating enzyme